MNAGTGCSLFPATLSNTVTILMQETARVPTFFLVGAPKTGSTSLYRFLRQHPQIYMSPVKEPSFFSDEVRPDNFSREFRKAIKARNGNLREFLDGSMEGPNPGGIVETWADYQKLFRNARNEIALGEASVCYLWSSSAARNIRTRIPDAKILIVLRDPVERAFSQYVHCASNGLIRRSFRGHVRLSERGTRRPFDTLYPFLEWGFYHEQVKRYLDLFPRSQVKIFIYEEAWRTTDQFLEAIFEHIGVDSYFRPNTSRNEHEFRPPRSLWGQYALRKTGLAPLLKSVVPRALRETARDAVFRQRKALQLTAADRAYVADYYREDVRRLSALLNIDLGVWCAAKHM